MSLSPDPTCQQPLSYPPAKIKAVFGPAGKQPHPPSDWPQPEDPICIISQKTPRNSAFKQVKTPSRQQVEAGSEEKRAKYDTPINEFHGILPGIRPLIPENAISKQVWGQLWEKSGSNSGSQSGSTVWGARRASPLVGPVQGPRGRTPHRSPGPEFHCFLIAHRPAFAKTGVSAAT